MEKQPSDNASTDPPASFDRALFMSELEKASKPLPSDDDSVPKHHPESDKRESRPRDSSDPA